MPGVFKTLKTPGKTLECSSQGLGRKGQELKAEKQGLNAYLKLWKSFFKAREIVGKVFDNTNKGSKIAVHRFFVFYTLLKTPTWPWLARRPVPMAAGSGLGLRFSYAFTPFTLPPPPMRKLITNFDNVAKMDIGPLAQNCLTSMVGNARYPDAGPLTDAVQAALGPYQTAAAILHPTPTQTAELAQRRVALNQALSAVASMANALYADNEAALLSTGLTLSKERERHTTLEVPGKFQLVDGPQPGTLCAKAKRVPHSVALKYLYTLDPKLPDSQWFVVVVRDGDALLTACKTADRVYCKVAAVGGDTDQQPFTDVLSRIVQ